MRWEGRQASQAGRTPAGTGQGEAEWPGAYRAPVGPWPRSRYLELVRGLPHERRGSQRALEYSRAVVLVSCSLQPMGGPQRL